MRCGYCEMSHWETTTTRSFLWDSSNVSTSPNLFSNPDDIHSYTLVKHPQLFIFHWDLLLSVSRFGWCSDGANMNLLLKSFLLLPVLVWDFVILLSIFWKGMGQRALSGWRSLILLDQMTLSGGTMTCPHLSVSGTRSCRWRWPARWACRTAWTRCCSGWRGWSAACRSRASCPWVPPRCRMSSVKAS